MADLRAERTRGYLREALMDILHTKPYNQVTVREVVERARVSKNSFYNHYADLASLAQDCLMQQSIYFGMSHKRLRDYVCREDACRELLDQTAHTLLFYRENPNLAHVILDNICISPYFSEIRHVEEELIIDHLETEYGASCAPYLSFEDCARYVVWGMYGQYRKWVQEGMRAPIEATVKEIIRFALQSTAGMAGRAIESEYLATIEAWRGPEDTPM